MTNGRQIGKVAEREVAAILRDHGFDARRGVQYEGSSDSPDVIGLPGHHIEVKKRKKGLVELYDWRDQASREAGEDSIPVVIARVNLRPWLVIVNLEDYAALIRRLEDAEYRIKGLKK